MAAMPAYEFEAAPDPQQPGRIGYRILSECEATVARLMGTVVNDGSFAHVSFEGPIRFVTDDGPRYGAVGYSVAWEAVQ